MKKGLDFLFESFLLENNKMKNLLSITFFVLCYACSSNERIFDVDNDIESNRTTIIVIFCD